MSGLLPRAGKNSPDEAGNKIKMKPVDEISRLSSVEVSGVGLALGE